MLAQSFKKLLPPKAFSLSTLMGKFHFMMLACFFCPCGFDNKLFSRAWAKSHFAQEGLQIDSHFLVDPSVFRMSCWSYRHLSLHIFVWVSSSQG